MYNLDKNILESNIYALFLLIILLYSKPRKK